MPWPPAKQIIPAGISEANPVGLTLALASTQRDTRPGRSPHTLRLALGQPVTLAAPSASRGCRCSARQPTAALLLLPPLPPLLLLPLRGVMRSVTLMPMWSLGYSVRSDSVGRSPHSCASNT